MTKPVICRIIQSRPLDAAGGLSRETLPQPAAVRRPNIHRGPLPRQYPIHRASPKAPRGIWIDYLA